MSKRKNREQQNNELPNRYGRKPSILVRERDGATLETFDSRRQARSNRKEVCEERGLKTYETRIVPNGAQKD